MRALLLLIAFAGFGHALGRPEPEAPARLSEHPGLVTEADRFLLADRGYRLGDGFVRLGDAPPLSARQIREALARLKEGLAAKTASDLRDAPAGAPAGPAALDARHGERVRVSIERVHAAWAKGGPGATLSVFDGPPSQAAAFLSASALAVEARPDGTLVRTGAAAAHAPFAGAGAEWIDPKRGAFPRLVSAALGERSLGAAASPVRFVHPKESPLGQAIALSQGKPAGKGPAAKPIPGAVPPPPVAPGQPPSPNPKAPAGRLASIFLSEDILNAAIKEHLKLDTIRDVELSFDAGRGHIVARGLMRVPISMLRKLNLDGAKVPDFKFQMTIQPKTTKEGHLILLFPLQETFFHPADSTDPQRDRVIVPVQFLELALASARGYLGVLSGDYSSFDRKATAIFAEMSRLDKEIAAAKEPAKKEALADERQLLALSLQALPIERRQAKRMADRLGSVLGFVSERDIRLSDDLSADKNSIILKLKLAQLTPFLKGIQLGGVRVLLDTRDGSGEKFLAIDLVKAAP